MDNVLMVIFLLFTKHFIVDFPLQTKFQWSNKGTYWHPGGLLHAALHGVGTFMCLVFVSPATAALLALFDFVIHYHIDFVKINLNKHYGWGPTTHEQFWWLLGFDQYLHALTYIGFAAII